VVERAASGPEPNSSLKASCGAAAAGCAASAAEQSARRMRKKEGAGERLRLLEIV
jgi:hypothetical protein